MDVMSITDLGEAQVEIARSAHSGRAAHTVHGGSGHALRQVVMALAAGRKLAEHENPGETTLLVLSGKVELSAVSTKAALATGDYVIVPPERHDLTALEDSAVLLTIVSRAS